VTKLRSRQTESLDTAQGRMHVKAEVVVVEPDVRVAEEQAWRFSISEHRRLEYERLMDWAGCRLVMHSQRRSLCHGTRLKSHNQRDALSHNCRQAYSLHTCVGIMHMHLSKVLEFSNGVKPR
jgi:hypothetical protein